MLHNLNDDFVDCPNDQANSRAQHKTLEEDEKAISSPVEVGRRRSSVLSIGLMNVSESRSLSLRCILLRLSLRSVSRENEESEAAGKLTAGTGRSAARTGRFAAWRGRFAGWIGLMLSMFASRSPYFL